MPTRRRSRPVQIRAPMTSNLVRKEGEMLNSVDAIATIAVKDIAAATSFYRDTIGLIPLPTDERGVQLFKSGGTKVLIYESHYAGTNHATAVTWTVGEELERVVEALKAKGVQFEHYNLPGTKRDGDIHVAGKSRVAWCKDPDGNILAIVSQ
jgi:catechol-2,3-dioxygenase